MIFKFIKSNKIIHYKLKCIITTLTIGIVSIILLTPTSTAFTKDKTVSVNQQAEQLSNKIKTSTPNSLISTINNNGKLIDLKKDNEGKVYVTEHNSDKALIDINKVHTNSCEFWINTAVIVIGIVVFVALAMLTGSLGEFLITTFGLATIIGLDIAMLIDGILAGFDIYWIADIISNFACEKPNRHHWDKMPKQGDSIPVRASDSLGILRNNHILLKNNEVIIHNV